MTFESAILAGGKNSRYGGKNKAFLQVEGVPIIDRNIEVLSQIFSQISIITNHPQQFSEYIYYPMYSDYYHEIGPLAGIHSALKNTKSDGVFVSSCDMPFLNKNLIERLINKVVETGSDALIPRVNGDIEPLFAFYHKRIISKLEAHIIDGKSRSIRSFLKKINTEYMDLSDSATVRKSFTNINRPEDLQQIS